MHAKTAGLIVSTIALGALLAGCTGHSPHAADAASTGVAGGGSGNSSGGGAASVGAVGAPDASTSGKGGTGFDAAAIRAPGPSVIRTADMTVATDHVSSAADQARRVVSDVGGTVDGDDRTSGAHPSATMTLRIPPDQLGSVLAKLSALGKEQTRNSSTRDVTTDVADVDSRVRSAAAAIAQLRDLYGKATRVSDIIAIESELSQRESDLEALQAQQRSLAGQVAQATVTLYLVPPTAAVHRAASRHGFLGGLSNGWHAFSHGLAVLVTGLGAALPFLIVVGIAGGTWLVVRRRRPVPTLPPMGDPVS